MEEAHTLLTATLESTGAVRCTQLWAEAIARRAVEQLRDLPGADGTALLSTLATLAVDREQ